MNLQQNSQYLWNIVFSQEEAFEFCWSSFADEHNTFPKSTRRNVKFMKIEQICIWNPMTTGLSKHWFTSSVWNFCRSVADVPPREKSLSGDERGETSTVRRLLSFWRHSLGNSKKLEFYKTFKGEYSTSLCTDVPPPSEKNREKRENRIKTYKTAINRPVDHTEET